MLLWSSATQVKLQPHHFNNLHANNLIHVGHGSWHCTLPGRALQPQQVRLGYIKPFLPSHKPKSKPTVLFMSFVGTSAHSESQHELNSGQNIPQEQQCTDSLAEQFSWVKFSHTKQSDIAVFVLNCQSMIEIILWKSTSVHCQERLSKIWRCNYPNLNSINKSPRISKDTPLTCLIEHCLNTQLRSLEKVLPFGDF